MSYSRTNQFPALAMLGLVMLAWAGNAIFGRAVRMDIGPFTLAFSRWVVASLILAPFALDAVRKEARSLLKHWKIVLVLGLLGVGGFNGLLYAGLKYAPASNAVLLQASVPAMVMVLDRLLFRARPEPMQAFGVVIAMLGVALVVTRGDPAAIFALQFGKGEWLTLAAVFLWSLYTVLLRLRPQISPLTFVFTTFLIGALTMAPAAAVEWMTGTVPHWTPTVLGAIAYVAIFPSIFAYFVYVWATARVGPVVSGQAITLTPLFAALLSSFFLGEKLYGYHIAGMALILVGTVIAPLGQRRKKANKELASAL